MTPSLLQEVAEASPTYLRPEIEDYHAVHDLDGLLARLGTHLQLAGAAAPAGRPEPPRSESRERLVDAFLCVAGMAQVLSDHLHRDPAGLGKTAKYSSRLDGLGASILTAGLRAAAASLPSARAQLAERGLARWLLACEDLALELARAVWGAGPGSPPGAPPAPAGEAVLRGVPRRRPGRSVAIPPRCFFGFDQRPEDCHALAAKVAARHPRRERPLLVVGVRTSGCFLAPVQAAALLALGYSEVRWISWRPGQPCLPADRAALGWAVGADALVLVTDDPPTSGGSFARVAEDLVRQGVSSRNLTLLLQVFPDRAGDTWRQRLEPWQSLLVEPDGWHAQGLLEPRVVEDAVGALLTGRAITTWLAGRARRVEVAAVTCAGLYPLPPPGRGHLRARLDVCIRTAAGESIDHSIHVKGVGVGFFGRRSLAIASRLGAAVPEVYGIQDGLLYRAWVPDELAVGEGPVERLQLSAAIGRYVVDRARALPVDRDLAQAASGHDALWEQCARWLGPTFGRAALPLRPLLHRLGRRLLTAEKPSLIDGDMGPGHWFWSSRAPSRSVLKVGWDERALVYQVPFTYDPAFDVAAAAAERAGDPEFGRRLRREFESASGELNEVRWFLHRLLHLLDHRDALPATDWERRLGALHGGFLAGHLLGDVEVPTTGPLAAIDIDGVLETAWRSYSAPTPLGLLALRGLIVHGYRPLLVTGRSAAEVAERCRAFRLPGAVVEYGAGLVDAEGGFECLLTGRQLQELDRFRDLLSAVPGMEVDAAHRWSVRAFQLRGGRRRALPEGLVATILTEAGLKGRLRPVPGLAQTDFVAVGVDKGTGAIAIARRLGVPGKLPLRLAVGDSLPDLPVFALSELSACPASADPAIRAQPAIFVARRPFQGGLHDAVASLLGHAPGGCPECAPPPVGSVQARLLLDLLDAEGRSWPGKLNRVARLAVGAIR